MRTPKENKQKPRDRTPKSTAGTIPKATLKAVWLKTKEQTRTAAHESFERVLFQTRSIQQQLGSSPPLETFDGTIFTKLVNRVQVSPTTIEFKFMNGMTLSEKRSSL